MDGLQTDPKRRGDPRPSPSPAIRRSPCSKRTTSSPGSCAARPSPWWSASSHLRNTVVAMAAFVREYAADHGAAALR